jgi:deazaflavin-dependent oxidoreductase (nitroreductase family)
MPLPRAIARFQRRVTNPFARLWAPVLPGYGVVIHTGRRSGTVYRTPLNVFRRPGGFAVVIAYGRESDWLRNVRAANGGEIISRRRRYPVTNPRLVSGSEAHAALPLYGRLISRYTRSPDVLFLDIVSGSLPPTAAKS